MHKSKCHCIFQFAIPFVFFMQHIIFKLPVRSHYKYIPNEHDLWKALQSSWHSNYSAITPHASGCKWHSLLRTVRSSGRCHLRMVPNPKYILMNVICGKPLSHHGTQTLLPLLCRQVNANDTRLYAWVSQLINDPFEATGSFFRI